MIFRLKKTLASSYKMSKILSISYIVVCLIYIKCMMRGVYVIKQEIKKDKN